MTPTRIGHDDRGPEHEDAVRIIQAAYDRLALLIGRSGKPIEFTLSNFETLRREVFDEIYWADIETFPSGWVLDVMPISKSYHEGLRHGLERLRRKIRYEAKWKEKGFHWSEFPEGRKMLTYTVAQAVEYGKEAGADWAPMTSLTRYEVDVTYEGRRRFYRAAFLWLPAKAEGEWAFIVGDNVTQGVDWAAREGDISEEWKILKPARPEPGEDLGESRDDGGLQSVAGKAKVCESVSSPVTDHADHQGTDGHFTGQHFSHADYAVTCTCESNCTSRCAASLANAVCAETAGIRDVCHKMATNQNSKNGLELDGDVTPAACGAGLGCLKRGCLLCNCDLSVTVGILLAEVTFTTNGSPDWTANSELGVACSRCTVFPEPDGTPQDPVPLPPPSCLPDCSPIVLDLEGNGFRFTGLEDAVIFDIDGDGAWERVTWTEEGSDDTFLALDRNGNGLIDGARELFGTATQQPETLEPNGFYALAVFDVPDNGGNGDGLISPADSVFNDLLLWRDANHDGVSQPWELADLGSAQIESIALDFTLSGRRDRHGNLLRWVSRVDLGGIARPVAADVVFRASEL